MSYILEALKKSDKERQRENIPDLQADHSLPSARRGERKGPGLYLLGVLVLGGIAALVWYQFFGGQVPQLADNSKTVSVPAVVVQAPEVSEISKQTAALSSVTQRETAVELVKSEVTTVELVPPEVTLPERPIDDVAEPEVPISVVSKELAEVGGESAPPVSSEPAGQDEVVIPLFDELPPHMKAGVPELSFSGHVYADESKKRLIIINSRIVREGDMISDGLFLKEISPDGVVLRYKTAVFRVQLF